MYEHIIVPSIYDTISPSLILIHQVPLIARYTISINIRNTTNQSIVDKKGANKTPNAKDRSTCPSSLIQLILEY